jgi:hypothetical protein
VAAADQFSGSPAERVRVEVCVSGLCDDRADGIRVVSRLGRGERLLQQTQNAEGSVAASDYACDSGLGEQPPRRF